MSYIIFVNPNILAKQGCHSSSLLINDYCNGCQHISDGSFRKRSLRISTRDGVKCSLHLQLYSALDSLLARSISNGIHLWLVQYFYYCNKVRKMITCFHSGQYATCHRGGLGFSSLSIYFRNANLLEFLSDSKTITVIAAAYNVATEAYSCGVFSVNSNGGIVPSLSCQLHVSRSPSCSDWFS